MECLKQVVGLSDRDCLCTDPGKPQGADDSKSGLFVDDAFEGVQLIRVDFARECQDELWPILQKARDKAINEVTAELTNQMSSLHDKSITPFSGRLGNPRSATKKILNVHQNIVFALSGKESTPYGAQLILDAVGVHVDTAGTYTLTVYKNSLSDEVASFDIEHDGKKGAHKSIEPLNIELVGITGEINTYYFHYNLNGAKPYNTQGCSSCGTEPAWKKHIQPYIGDHDNLSLDVKKSDQMHGLFFNGRLTCSHEWLCGSFDWRHDKYAWTLANAIQLSAIRNLAKYVLGSGEINRFTILDQETLSERIAQLTYEIEGRINWLATQIPPQAEGCWKCRKNQTVAGIFV